MSSEKISKSTLEAKANAGTFRENADGQLDASDLARLTNARLANPLLGLSHEKLAEMGEAFAREYGLEEFIDEFSKGAVIAQNPEAFEGVAILDDADKLFLRREYTHKWSQPLMLYYQTVCCSMAAAVQGMDESVVNGANIFWPAQFGLYQAFSVATGTSVSQAATNQLLLGLTTGAPYLCCAIAGCWITDPLNARLGRRGAIFVTATISFVTVIWSACTNTWWHLFIARFFLGFGIGPKSATVPVFAAEVAPQNIRGALVMQWQVWTAFGIMIATVVNLAFFAIPDIPGNGIIGLNWRLMLGSAAFPALLVMAQVFFVPESPRWLISKGRYPAAYDAMCRYRNSKLQAARDIFFIHCLLEEEKTVEQPGNRYLQLFTVPRNRRAALASGIVMFMQQFCGINVIAYYSTTIFTQAGFSQIQAFVASLGFGTINFLFAAPAVYTIDTFGRRFLLLATFPLMAIFLLMTGFAFYIPATSTARIAVVALGIYLHDISYSPGEGPVPFTYSAEAFPLICRDIGMSFATAVTWGFNFIVAFTFPRLLVAFTPTGAFGFYAACNIAGWFLILAYVPETKALTLEQLDQVFSVPTNEHAAYQFRQIPYMFNKYVLRRDVGPQEQLYVWDKTVSTESVPEHAESIPEAYVEKGSPKV